MRKRSDSTICCLRQPYPSHILGKNEKGSLSLIGVTSLDKGLLLDLYASKHPFRHRLDPSDRDFQGGVGDGASMRMHLPRDKDGEYIKIIYVRRTRKQTAATTFHIPKYTNGEASDHSSHSLKRRNHMI